MNMFLNKWHKDDDFYIFLLNHKTNENKTFKHNNESFNKYEETIEHYNDNGYSVYYTVNSFDSDSSFRRKDTVREIKAIWLDVDTPETAEEIYSKVVETFGRPSYKIRTSKGKFQVLYKLKKPLKNTPRNRFIVESTMKILAKYFDTDMSTVGIQQIFRLPGFKNCKYDNTDSYVMSSSKKEYDLIDFVRFANKVKTDKVFEKKINKFELQDIEITVNKYEGIDNDHKRRYGYFLKIKNRDASIADILYIKNRKRDGVAFNVIMKEITELREYYKKPFKRDFALYYSDREKIYYEA